MSPTVDVLIYVQHLLGIGHLARAAILARALQRRGLGVVFVSGGLPVSGLDVGEARFEQLPPVKAGDAAFSFLADDAGRPLTDRFKAERRDRLLAMLATCRPKALLIEMFPFGRRALRFELLPLLEAARAQWPAAKIVCSLRDILNHPTPAAKADWIVATANRWVDLVLVHGDPAFIALDRTFPRARDLACRVEHTGYVAPEPNVGCGPVSENRGEVLVSAGGGAVGLPLLRCAIAARPLSRLAAKPWRVLVGPSLSDQALAEIASAVPEVRAEGLIVERPQRDFRALLRGARLSISQAGYNTLVEVLQAAVPAVVVPFAEGGETEQSTRASAMADRGLVTLVAADRVTPEALARAIDRTIEADGATAPAPATGGAERSAEIMAELIGGAER